MKIHIPPRERRALTWHLANFIKAIALEHNDGTGGGRMSEAELDIMIPYIAGSLRVEPGNRNRPRGFLAAFKLPSIKFFINLVIWDGPTSVEDWP